ncbi:MAG: hypothetical protein KAS60_00395 [Thermoplasmata archaeon]|nr:hypothetical protein [Candidatus Thermoplasmatota archaeon]MCK4948536.1 hypothetical protein [Thermoplasmata archaeon]
MNREIKHYGLVVALLLVCLGLLTTSLEAYSGGWQDGDTDYNCGTSCHQGGLNQGAGTIDVVLDTPSVLSGQTLTITVNVTETQLGTDRLVGVFLLSSKTGSGDHPSSQGWTITQDPNGGTVNYVEKESPGSGETVSFKWTLKAPLAWGDYELFVRVHHGSLAKNPLWEDHSGSISVEVTPLPAGTPEIDHQAVSLGYIGENTPIEAYVVNATRVVLNWRVAGEIQYNSSEMTNTTEVSDGGWKFEGEIPAQSSIAQVEYFIVAYHELNGDPIQADTSVYTISIEPKPEVPNTTAWTIQIIIVSEIALFILIAGVRMGKARGKKEDEQNG